MIYLLYFLLFIFLIKYLYLLGRKFLYIFFKNDFSFGEEFLLSFGIGVGISGFTVYLLGQLHILYPLLIISLVILSGIYLIFDFLKNDFSKYFIKFKRYLSQVKNFKKLFCKKNTFEIICLILLVIVLIVGFFITVSPELGYDSLWYHLELPKVYLAEHQITFFSSPAQLAPAAVMPRLMDLNFGFFMSFGGDEIMPKLFQYTLLILSIILIYLFGVRYFSKKTGFFAAVLLVFIVPIQQLMGTAYIDFGSLFLGSCAVYCFYTWFKNRQEVWFNLAFIFCGLSLATKFWNVLLLVLFIIALVILKEYKKILKFFLGSIIFVLPFYIEAFYYTRNPFYPVFSVNDADHMQGATSLLDWVLRVHPKTVLYFTTKDFFLQSPFLILLPCLFFVGKNYKKILFLLLFSIGYLLLWSYIPVHEIRYMAAGLLPILIIFSFSFYDLIFKNQTIKIICQISLIFYLCFNALIFVIANKKFIPPTLAQNARSQFIAENTKSDFFIYFDKNNYLLNHLNGGEKALVLAHNMFYINFSYIDGFRLANDLNKIKSPDELLNYLKQNNISYLTFQGNYKVKHFFELIKNVNFEENWIQNHLDLVYENSNNLIQVYKIK